MQTVTTIGLDIAKSVFQVHGVDAAGQVVPNHGSFSGPHIRGTHVPSGGAVHSITTGLMHCTNGIFIRSDVEAGPSVRTQSPRHPRDG